MAVFFIDKSRSSSTIDFMRARLFRGLYLKFNINNKILYGSILRILRPYHGTVYLVRELKEGVIPGKEYWLTEDELILE